MKYGYFDKKRKEYVITNPKTPTPWINYIGNGNYGGIVSNTGGGYSFYKDPRNCRILRYRYNSIPMDQPGRYIYIKDKKDGDFWSAGWQPTKKNFDYYKCSHGLGWTKIDLKYKEIFSSITYFVPLEDNMEIWVLELKNLSNIVRKLKIFSYAEFSFYDAVKDQQNVDWVQQILQGDYKNGVIYFYNFMKERFTYFSSNKNPDGFDCSLEKFVGKYNSLESPEAVVKGKCSNSICHRGNGVGALSYNVKLLPQQTIRIIFYLGTEEQIDVIPQKLKKYKDYEFVENKLKQISQYWENYLSKISIETPESDIDHFVNVWNQYQCKVCFDWSRFVSMYQLGIDRGMGFRDSSQDVLGVTHSIPEKSKELIIKLLKNQFVTGDSYHQYYPLTGEGEGRGFSDDHLWIILSVLNYIKETGDVEFLNYRVEFADSGRKETVYTHLQKAIDYTSKNLGPHGLPLAGVADWNDTLNFTGGKGIAESVFVAFLYGKMLDMLVELTEFLGIKNDKKFFQNKYEEMKKNVNKYAWDGNWWLRAYDDFGKKIGSAENKKGKIFLNSQSWAIISGFSSLERGVKSLNWARKYLNTKYGLMLMSPPYDKFDPKLGGVTTYPPYAKENSGIFMHANPWMIIAETILGRGDYAFEYYKKILPINKNNIADKYEVEPYVFCQNVLGKGHPLFGLGRNSWLTGTASWSFITFTNYILGIRPTYNRLVIDPCIPKKWSGFTVKRYFRDAVYNINIKNPKKVNKGVKLLKLNGKEINSQIIPLQEKHSENNIEVILG